MSGLSGGFNVETRERIDREQARPAEGRDHRRRRERWPVLSDRDLGDIYAYLLTIPPLPDPKAAAILEH
jgi:hypothetical protein